MDAAGAELKNKMADAQSHVVDYETHFLPSLSSLFCPTLLVLPVVFSSAPVNRNVWNQARLHVDIVHVYS